MSRPDAVAIVFAMDEEARPLVRDLDDREPLAVGGLRGWRGTLGGRRVAVAVTGEGLDRATAGARALLASSPFEGLLGLGFGAGLTPDLRAGDLVWGSVVSAATGDVQEPPDSPWRDGAEGSGAFRKGALVTVDSILRGTEEKRAAAASHRLEKGAVGDLESAGWARSAVAVGVPWLVVRAISDIHDERLAIDFDRFRRPDGSVDRRRVLTHAALRPALWPSLGGLAVRARGCARSLATSVRELLA